jgi:hypothetical protein
MTDFERFAKALALTETHDLETAWGDAKSERPLTVVGHEPGSTVTAKCNFMAVGRWQMHPAWYHDWMRTVPPVGSSWDECFKAALLAFYATEKALGRSPMEMAMTFHIGHWPILQADWDEKYAERFANYYAQLGNPAPPAKGG